MPEHTGREDLPEGSVEQKRVGGHKAAGSPGPKGHGQGAGPPASVPQSPSRPTGPGRSGAARERAASGVSGRVDHLPPFKVLLHNDDVHDTAHVVQSLIELTPLRLEAAVRVTESAHAEGVALVLVAHRERAELYCEQFAGRGLCASIEAA